MPQSSRVRVGSVSNRLNMSTPTLHQIITLPPIRPHRADLLLWAERLSRQPLGVQLHQPLTLLHVTFAPRQILRLRAFYQVHFETNLFQVVVYPQSSTRPLIASRPSEFGVASANRPWPAARLSCNRSAVPVGCPVSTVRPRSGIRCRYQCPPHRDASPPNGGLRSGSSVASLSVACGSSLPNWAALDDRLLFCLSPFAWVSCELSPC